VEGVGVLLWKVPSNSKGYFYWDAVGVGVALIFFVAFCLFGRDSIRLCSSNRVWGGKGKKNTKEKIGADRRKQAPTANLFTGNS